MRIQEAVIEGYNILKEENIETYMIDTQLLLCKAINKDKLFIIINRDMQLTEIEEKTFFEYIDLRTKKMPIKYILEQCEFMALNFNIKPGVLIPRPDTEVLVEWAIKNLKSQFDKKVKTLNTIINNVDVDCSINIRVCDLCCGSGIIGLSVAEYILKHMKHYMMYNMMPNQVKLQNEILATWFNVDLYDISDVALEVTANNIEKLNLGENCAVYYSDLLDYAINKNYKYDMLLSNPPYISSDDICGLMEDVKNYEPELALCGGADGLDFYRKIICNSKRVLKPHGYIGFEIGYDQGTTVSTLLSQNNFKEVEIMKDLNGLDRIVVGHL